MSADGLVRPQTKISGWQCLALASTTRSGSGSRAMESHDNDSMLTGDEAARAAATAEMERHGCDSAAVSVDPLLQDRHSVDLVGQLVVIPSRKQNPSRPLALSH